MNSSVKSIVFWIFILLCPTLLWGVVERGAQNKEPEYAYSDLFNKVQSGQVLIAVIQGDELRGHLKTSPKDQFRTTLRGNYDDLLKAMIAANVNFTIKEPQNNFLSPLLINAGPFVLLCLASLLVVPPFWEILRKAGFHPILSLLMLLPLVNLVALYVVAFSPWKPAPALKS